jgi:hypothetical protein
MSRDTFEDAHSTAVHFDSVLRELAGTKASGDTPDDEERAVWWGIKEMVEAILQALEVMHHLDVQQLYTI